MTPDQQEEITQRRYQVEAFQADITRNAWLSPIGICGILRLGRVTAAAEFCAALHPYPALIGNDDLTDALLLFRQRYPDQFLTPQAKLNEMKCFVEMWGASESQLISPCYSTTYDEDE